MQMNWADFDFSRSWERCAGGLGLDLHKGRALMRELLSAYGQPGRHYHTCQHLAECLQLLDESHHWASQPHALEMALWFHDAVYDPRASDNEAQSGRWALEALSSLGCGEQDAQRIQHWVLLTRTHMAENDPDAALLLDIDLSILAASPARFAEYEQQIRCEYAHVPHWLFRLKRRSVLQQFLDRHPIYHTPQLRERWEAAARANLQTALG